MGYYYILQDGKIVPTDDLEVWADWFEHGDRIIEQTRIGEVLVSTVCLGLNNSFGEGDPPVLFESMIFGGFYDGEQAGYSTMEAAKLGHVRMVTLAKRGKVRAIFDKLISRIGGRS